MRSYWKELLAQVRESQQKEVLQLAPMGWSYVSKGWGMMWRRDNILQSLQYFPHDSQVSLITERDWKSTI